MLKKPNAMLQNDDSQTVEFGPATPADRLPLARMLELYQYELSDIWDQDLDVHGEYGYLLDRYWSNKTCCPFVARVNGNYAGFALVNRDSPLGADARWMDQFFVLKKYRRSGIGKRLAGAVISCNHGLWNVGQMTRNVAAREFWLAVIGEITNNRFTEKVLTEGWWQGYLQVFEVEPAPSGTS